MLYRHAQPLRCCKRTWSQQGAVLKHLAHVLAIAHGVVVCGVCFQLFQHDRVQHWGGIVECICDVDFGDCSRVNLVVHLLTTQSSVLCTPPPLSSCSLQDVPGQHLGCAIGGEGELVSLQAVLDNAWGQRRLSQVAGTHLYRCGHQCTPSFSGHCRIQVSYDSLPPGPSPTLEDIIAFSTVALTL